MSADRAAWKDSHAGHLHLEREFEAKTPEVCEETVRGQLVLRSGPQAQLFFLLILHKGQRYYRLAMWLGYTGLYSLALSRQITVLSLLYLGGVGYNYQCAKYCI